MSVERRKVALLSAVFLAVPLTALAFSFTLSSFGHSIFSLVCHQVPERSLYLGGTMPLCARCFGLYFGFGLAGFFAPAFSTRFSGRFLLAGIFASLTLAALGPFFPALDANYLRLFLGLAVGAGLALLIKSVLK
ncbi:MAG: DUF2085 domain-containing protein [candidate division Zixibacteria bacterium]|nr:DUF2085 domain-containing protein [candidate division Zixibacteria bacterium]